MTKRQVMVLTLLAITLLSVVACGKRSTQVQASSSQASSQAQATSSPKPLGEGFTCGVATKKGTPCKRRVKAQGAHCWQHSK